MRILALLATVSLLAAVSTASPAAIVTGRFPQRLSHRYTMADGLPPGEITHLTVVSGQPYVWVNDRIYTLTGSRWAPSTTLLGRPFADVSTEGLPRGAKVRSTAFSSKGKWAATDQGVFRLDGRKASRVPFPQKYLTRQRPVNADAELTCAAVDSTGTVWFGSNVGLFATDGADWWNVIDREDGLPYEEVTCIAFGKDGDLWVGTTQGVCRQTGGEWEYYWGPRWLPGNRILSIEVAGDGSAWVASDRGVAHLYSKPITLAEKSAHYQAITEQRHNRRGYVTGSRLRTPGKPEAGVVFEASDNDGLWTALYVAAQSFRYAATQEPAAREQAKRSMHAMLDLVRYSGIPGYPARAVVTRGELARGEADGYDANETVRVPGETEKIWYPSPVDPEVLCKGDTSSDELDGHYFAWLTYYELAADEADRKAVRETVAAVTDHLLKHDLTLVGHTGRKTRWGVYSPKYINDDPVWWMERGLNSLSMLAYLKVAHHITGHARFQEEARTLTQKHHYLLNTVTQKLAEPWWDVNHSDDEMAFMMLYAILRVEKDPDSRRVLLQSLERSWRVERPEASPFFNFVYGAHSGRPYDGEAAVTTLRDWPWELIEWETRGTHRHDVQVVTRRGPGRAQSQLTRALPASERRLMRWNGNPYQADGGTPDGRSEEDGTAWLISYWMGRCHGLLREDAR